MLCPSTELCSGSDSIAKHRLFGLCLYVARFCVTSAACLARSGSRSTKMSVCFDDWSPRSSNFPGLSCRTLDFSLAFSSIFLAILPYCCFLLLSALRLYTVIKEDIKLESKTLLASALCWGKLCCSALLILGSAIATAGSIGDDISALGVAAFALAIPTAVRSLQLQCSQLTECR